MNQHKTSEFYQACRNGDVNAVTKLLSKLTPTDIDRVESNGSTGLHAASYFGHANIVRLLLDRGASRMIRNKYGKTAKEEASTLEVRVVFESVVDVKEGGDDDIENMPQCQLFRFHRNTKGINKSVLVTRIVKTRMYKYPAEKYSILTTPKIEHLEKQHREVCKEDDDNYQLGLSEEYFKQFRQTSNFIYMMKLYTFGTDFVNIVNGDEMFLMDMYKYLLPNVMYYGFEGRAYLAFVLLPNEFEAYRWAHAHPQSLLETRNVIEAVANRNHMIGGLQKKVGEDRRRVLIEMDFTTNRCFTVFSRDTFQHIASEIEIHILPGTFFEVTGIRDDKDGVTIVSLNAVSVTNDAFSTTN